MAFVTAPPSGFAASDLVTQSANYLPKMWKKGAEVSEQDEDFFQEFEGKGLMAPIRVETDFNKDAGQFIQFRNRAGLYGDGVRGDALVGDTAEPWKVGEYSLAVDYLRHATGRTQRTEDQTGLRNEIEAGVNEDLGKWMGRKKTKDISTMMRNRLHATSKVIANVTPGAKVSSESLKSSDVISMNGIITWGQQLKTMGGLPAMIGRTVGNNPILSYTLVSTGEALVALKQASDWKQAQRDGGVRGDDNVLFRGGYSRIDGHAVREWNPLDHDGRGAIGCAFLPKAVLGAAVTAGTATFDILGGGDAISGALTAPKYFEHFSNYAYQFGNAGTVAGSLAALAAADWNREGGATAGLSAPRYCIIYNLADSTGGAGDAGKLGFYQFTTNNGNKLVVTGRLGATGDIRATTIGNVDSTSAPWVGNITAAHGVGSVIIETNSYGVPFGYSVMLGAQAAVRGYGRFRNHRSEESYEGGFYKETFITSVFGQCPKPRTDGRTTNILRVLHAVQYAGLSLPIVA